MLSVKCMLIGDSCVGKTSIFKTYVTGSLPDEYTPTIFDTFTKEVTVNSELCQLTLWDSAGDELYDEVRPISYPHTDCFIICYSVDSKTSLLNVITKWKPETLRFGDGPSVPVILLGTKSDLRNSVNKEDLISEDEVEDLRTQIGAHCVMECSSRNGTGVKEVMEKALELGFTKKAEENVPPDPWGFEDLKVVVIGDPNVGKSTLLKASSRINADESKSSELDHFYQFFVYNGTEYFLDILELPCDLSETSRSMRVTEYLNAHCIVLCYSVTDYESLYNINTRWVPELSRFAPKIPIILTGTKIDLRLRHHNSEEGNDDDVLSTDKGEQTKECIKAASFFECSSKTGENISKLYEIISQTWENRRNVAENENPMTLAQEELDNCLNDLYSILK